MTGPLTNLKLLRRTNRILIGVFIGMLWLPTVDTFFHTDHTPATNEKRLLATFPKLKPGLAGLKEFNAGLEAYFNDHFGYRKQFIRWYNKWRWGLFQDRSVRNVIAGDDGWLFFSSNQMVDNYRGILRFSDRELRDWQTLLERRRDWLAQRHIRFLFIVAPDKQSIYPEHLPAWIIKVHPDTKLDQLLAHLRAHSTVEVLDLRPALRDARATAPTYFKTDTHWNLFGAFTAYQELIRTFARQQPECKPLALESFAWTNKTASGGNLSDFIGVQVTESNAIYFLPKPGLLPIEMTATPSAWRGEKTYRGQVLKPGEVINDLFGAPCPDFDTGPVVTRNSNATGRIAVFRDSYVQMWLPFLGHHFAEANYFWQYHLDAAWLEKQKPDIVVCEIAERYFNEANPKELQAKDALP